MLLQGERRAVAGDLPPPPRLVDANSLFLDFDGTLVELADRPDAVIVEAALVGLLRRAAARLDGRVAIVSGRSIAQLDALLGDVATTLAVAGSHGAERRTASGHLRPDLAPSLADAVRALETFAQARPGMVFERKSFGVALHYRQAPGHGAEALAFAERVAAEHGLVMQHGKMMAEVRMPGDKGQALRALIEQPVFAGSTPLFFGDDVTDEDGFVAAAAHGGAGVLVGEPRETAARYRIGGVAALRGWLTDGIAGQA